MSPRAARPRRPGGEHDAALVAAVERRFGLKLQPALHGSLIEAARLLVSEEVVSGQEEAIQRVSLAPLEDEVVRRLCAAASVGETYLFRGQEQLLAIQDVVRRRFVEPRRAKRLRSLRVWSAGCSTGEESYTLAMLFSAVAPDFTIQVVGSDMNERSLATARLARYGKRSLRSTPAPALLSEGSLLPSGGGWTLAPDVRRRAAFVRHNLVTDPLPCPELGLANFDVVVCRNVLIYVDAEQIPSLMARMAASCNPESVFVIGPAEYRAAAHATGFEDLSQGILYRGGLKAPVPSPPVAPEPARTPKAPARKAPPPVARSPEPAVEVPIAATLDELLEQSRRAADAGRFGEARALALAATQASADSALAYFTLATVHAAEGDGMAAVREYQKALFLDRRLVAAELGAGVALARMGRSSDARRHLQRALRLLDETEPAELVLGLGVPARVARRLAEDCLGEESHS